jgi:hypothetical protein
MRCTQPRRCDRVHYVVISSIIVPADFAAQSGEFRHIWLVWNYQYISLLWYEQCKGAPSFTPIVASQIRRSVGANSAAQWKISAAFGAKTRFSAAFGILRAVMRATEPPSD